MSNVKWETGYDRFLSLGSWMSVLLNGLPAAILLLGMYALDVNAEWWTPVLLVYLVASLAFALNYGFMALNIQMKSIADQGQKGLTDSDLN